MLARIYSAAVIGIEAQSIEVEVDFSMGLATFSIVGLPDKAISESKERIRAALKNSGYEFPLRAITVNLAPAHLKKQGAVFDMPIVIGLLLAAGHFQQVRDYLAEALFVGEVALDGAIKPVAGVLAVADYVRSTGKKRLFVPQANAAEAALVEGIEVFGVATLAQLCSHLSGEQLLTPEPAQFARSFQEAEARCKKSDLSEVRGQLQAKRALVIAAAGHHNLIMVGSPGAGKTMLAERFAGLLPPLTFAEIIAITKVYSVAGLLEGRSLLTRRPVRSPHHTISQAGLIGGGSSPRPGEVSLAHHGVLFLDELTEFSRSTIEVLRQPMESGMVHISRAQQAVQYPADFLLIAAMNPCPCGYFGDQKRCHCSPHQVRTYLGKISGPLLDRIDLHVGLRAPLYSEISPAVVQDVQQESSASCAARVLAARAVQKKRGQTFLNGQLSGEEVERYCVASPAAAQLIQASFDKLGLSMRGYHKMLKIARTIADLAASEMIEVAHMQEALGFRMLAR